MVAYVCDPSNHEAEARGLKVWLHSRTLPQKEKEKHWGDSSTDKGTSHKERQPELDLGKTHGRRGGANSCSYPLTSTHVPCGACAPTCPPLHIHTK